MKVEGEYPKVARVETGWHSFDIALSSPTEIGYPMTIVEIFGNQGIGKSTVSTSIAGVVAEHYKKNIVYAPIEHIDREYMENILDSVGFDQTVSILGGLDMLNKFLPLVKVNPKKGEIITDEMIFDSLIEAMRSDEYCFAILDSLTAVSPIEEMESSTADKNMGRRGRLSGVLARGALSANRFRKTPYSTIIIAHKVIEMGGGMKKTTGTDTTGGEGKKNIAKVRLNLSGVVEKTMSDLDKNCFIIKGRAEKMNFGKAGRYFHLAVLGGKGVHTGMTALYDCKVAGLASFGASITLDGKKYGAMRSIVAKAHDGDTEFFQPFIDALKDPTKIAKVDQEEDGEEYDE